MSLEDESRAAILSVVKACLLCREVQKNLVLKSTISKSDRSPVTVADYGAQAIVSHLLHAFFPEIPMVGEEDAGKLRLKKNASIRKQVIEHVQKIVPVLQEDEILEAIDRGIYAGGSKGRFWCLDPIDGTKGFLRRDQYAIALALIENGKVILGVLGCPELPLSLTRIDESCGCIFQAKRGEGTYMALLDSPEELRDIRVDMVTDPSWARFCESVEADHSSHDDSSKVAELLNVQAPPLRIDSQCKYAVVARGDASIYLRMPTTGISRRSPDRYIEKIWDHAAGSIIIEEAGGSVSDVYGKKLNFTKGRKLTANVGVVVTNGLLHDQVLSAVQETLGIEHG